MLCGFVTVEETMSMSGNESRHPAGGQDARLAFRVLVKNVASEIHPKDLKELAFLVEVGVNETTTVLDVFDEMMRKGRFSYTNVEPLQETLKNIDRHDLVTKYLASYRETYREAIAGAAAVQPPAARGQWQEGMRLQVLVVLYWAPLHGKVCA